MAPMKRTIVSQQLELENLDFKHFVDKYLEVFKTKLSNKAAEEIQNIAFSRFSNNLEDIPTWECGFAQAIVPTTFHFPKFVHMCT